MPNNEGEVQPSAFVIEIERDARHKLHLVLRATADLVSRLLTTRVVNGSLVRASRLTGAIA